MYLVQDRYSILFLFAEVTAAMPLHNADEVNIIQDIEAAYQALRGIVSNARLSIDIKRNALERFGIHYGPYFSRYSNYNRSFEREAKPIFISFQQNYRPFCLICSDNLDAHYGICAHCMQKRFPTVITLKDYNYLDFLLLAGRNLNRIHSYFNPIPLDNSFIA